MGQRLSDTRGLDENGSSQRPLRNDVLPYTCYLSCLWGQVSRALPQRRGHDGGPL